MLEVGPHAWDICSHFILQKFKSSKKKKKIRRLQYTSKMEWLWRESTSKWIFIFIFIETIFGYISWLIWMGSVAFSFHNFAEKFEAKNCVSSCKIRLRFKHARRLKMGVGAPNLTQLYFRRGGGGGKN